MDTTAIKLDRHVAEALATIALARGLSLEDFLRDIGGLPVNGQGAHNLCGDDLDRWLDELAAGPDTAESLPADFSRADIYSDHD